MRSLDFSNKISNGNSFDYTQQEGLPIFFTEDGENPFFLNSPEIEDRTMFRYSTAPQFGGGEVGQRTFEDALESAGIPIILNFCGYKWIVAKGFLALFTIDQRLSVVYMAKSKPNPTDMSEVTLYVRKTYAEMGKVIREILQDIIAKFNGETRFIPDMEVEFGIKIELPQFRTLQARKKWVDDLIEEGLKDMKKNYR